MKKLLAKLICVLILTVAVAPACAETEPPPIAELLPAETTRTPVGAENTVLNWVGASGMRWGVGIDTASMNIRNIAIDIDEHNLDDNIYSMGSWETFYTFQIIESQSSLRNHLGVASNTAMDIGLFKASNEGKYVKEQVKNTYSLYAYLEISVSGPAYNLMITELKPEAKQLLDENKYTDFVYLYGTQYLQTVTVGGLYRAVMEIKTSSQKDKQEVSNRMRAGTTTGTFSEDLSVKSDIQKLSKQYRMTITEFQRSGETSRSGLVQDVDTMLANGKAFLDSFQKGDWRNTAVTVSFQDYKMPAEPALSWKWAMRELASDYDKYNELLSSVQFIIAHQQWYTEADGWTIDLNGQTYTLQGLSENIESNILPDILDTAAWLSDHSQESKTMMEEKGYTETLNNIKSKLPVLDNFLPQTAAEIHGMYSTLGDGEYKLYYQGKEDQPYRVHISDLQSNDPKEYLMLYNNNYSGISSDKTYYKGKDITTTYTAIRINPVTLEINIHDNTQSETVGGPIDFYPYGSKEIKETFTHSNYGSAMDCNSKGPNNNSVAKIDLRGTSFAVHNDVQWEIGGHGTVSGGYSKFTMGRQVVDIKAANGTSGWAKPIGLKLEYIGQGH